jgi:DNA-binding transcriptional LysR family regulator
MLEHRSLRQFVVLAEELHFSRAAARLHMTQPPLTQAIQRLERDMGTALFVRSQRSVVLSPAGAALLPTVQRLLLQLDDLPRLARDAASGVSGRLRLAFVSSIGYGALPGWLRSFNAQHPDVTVELREATLDVQLAAFAAAEIDLGFVLHAEGAAPAGLSSWLALREPMVLALATDHPLAQRTRVPLAQLAREPLVIFPRHIAPSMFDAVLGVYRRLGPTPRIAQEAIQMQTLVNLVSAGLGVAWVPASMKQLQRPGVVYRPLVGTPLRCDTSLVWTEPAPPAVQRFVQHVQRPAHRQSGKTGTRHNPHFEKEGAD